MTQVLILTAQNCIAIWIRIFPTTATRYALANSVTRKHHHCHNQQQRHYTTPLVQAIPTAPWLLFSTRMGVACALRWAIRALNPEPSSSPQLSILTGLMILDATVQHQKMTSKETRLGESNEIFSFLNYAFFIPRLLLCTLGTIPESKPASSTS